MPDQLGPAFGRPGCMLVPGIHVLAARKNVDGRDKPGHDALRGLGDKKDCHRYSTPASSLSFDTSSATEPTLAPDLRPDGSVVLMTSSRGLISTP